MGWPVLPSVVGGKGVTETSESPHYWCRLPLTPQPLPVGRLPGDVMCRLEKIPPYWLSFCNPRKALSYQGLSGLTNLLLKIKDFPELG